MSHQSYVRIKPFFTIIPHSLNQVELRKGVWNPLSFTIADESGKGKLYTILKDLNGDFSVSEIANRNNISRAEVEGVLDQLNQLGILEFSSSSLLDYYIEQACPSMMQRLYSLAEHKSQKILFVGKNAVSAAIKKVLQLYIPESQMEYLSEESLQHRLLTQTNDHFLYDEFELQEKLNLFSDWKNYFVIMAQEVINPVFVERFNIIAHELQIPWIHGAIDGPFLYVGPLFANSNDACYHCFETRISMNLREHASYVKYKQAIASGAVNERINFLSDSPLIPLLTSHMLLEILNYLSTGTGFTRNKVLSIYLPTMEMIFNEVLRVSNCAVCGVIDKRDNGQLYFDYQSLYLSANP